MSQEPDGVGAVTRTRPDVDPGAREFARLRAACSKEDGVDPHSTLEQLPTAQDLALWFRRAAFGLIAHTSARERAGYGLVRSWVESDETTVHLLDCWAVPGTNRIAIESELFTGLETLVRAGTGPSPGVVLGANSRSTEPGRAALLTRLGFRPVLDMVEMHFPSSRLDRPPFPPGVVVRPAAHADAPAIAALEERVWAGRPFYTATSLAATRQWLGRVDPQLCLLAEHNSHLIDSPRRRSPHVMQRSTMSRSTRNRNAKVLAPHW